MTFHLREFATSAAVAALVSFVGCGPSEKPKGQAPTNNKASSPTHDPDDIAITEADVMMPANYNEAVPRIKSYRDTIRQAVEAKTPSKAHRSLDELDIVLDKLPAIAKASGISKDHWEAINTTAQELRSSFNQVHSAIDEKRDPDYKAVAEPIDVAIKKLEQVAEQSGK